MSVTWITELFDSQSATHGWTRGKGLRLFRFGEDEDYGTAKAYADARVAEAAYANLDGVDGGPAFEEYDIEHEGAGIWLFTLRYTSAPSREVGESSYQFNTGGATAHIKQAKAHVARYPGTAPNCQGAIGVTRDSIDGCDIITPGYQFSETHYLDDATVDAAYKLVLFNLTGKTNDAIFKGLAIGEVLFLGASGSKRGDSQWEITYNFSGAPNAASLTVGSITGIAKNGHDYLWAFFEDVADQDFLIKRAKGIYVERVYDSGDFSGLGIGT